MSNPHPDTERIDALETCSLCHGVGRYCHTETQTSEIWVDCFKCYPPHPKEVDEAKGRK